MDPGLLSIVSMWRCRTLMVGRWQTRFPSWPKGDNPLDARKRIDDLPRVRLDTF